MKPIIRIFFARLIGWYLILVQQKIEEKKLTKIVFIFFYY
jgi:hypothetical protein